MDENTLGQRSKQPSQALLSKPIRCLSLFNRSERAARSEESAIRWRRLLTVIVGAKLTGEVNRSAVVDWVGYRGEWLNKELGLSYRRWPWFSTSPDALWKLEAKACTAIISSALTRMETSRRGGSEPSGLLRQKEKEE